MEIVRRIIHSKVKMKDFCAIGAVRHLQIGANARRLLLHGAGYGKRWIIGFTL